MEIVQIGSTGNSTTKTFLGLLLICKFFASIYFLSPTFTLVANSPFNCPGVYWHVRNVYYIFNCFLQLLYTHLKCLFSNVYFQVFIITPPHTSHALRNGECLSSPAFPPLPSPPRHPLPTSSPGLGMRAIRCINALPCGPRANQEGRQAEY